jgi:hypothetical protein
MNHHEHDMHVEFYTLCCYNKLAEDIYAIEPGEKRNAITGAKLRKKGVQKEKGIADFLCTYPFKRYRAVWIEFKYGRNKQTSYQKDFEKRVTARGYLYFVSYSAANALSRLLELIAADSSASSGK